MDTRAAVRPGSPARRAEVLVPASRRVATGTAMAIAALVLFTGALRYAGTTTAGSLDTAIDSWFTARAHGHWLTAYHVAQLGGPHATLVLAPAVAALAAALRHRRALALAVLAPPTSAVLVEFVLKPLVDRRHLGGYSYPSGHAASIGTLALVFGLIVLTSRANTTPMRRAVARAAAGGAIAVAGVVVAALIAAGIHYATDTVGGVCVAVLVVGGLALGIDTAAERISRRRARPAVLRSRRR